MTIESLYIVEHDELLSFMQTTYPQHEHDSLVDWVVAALADAERRVDNAPLTNSARLQKRKARS